MLTVDSTASRLLFTTDFCSDLLNVVLAVNDDFKGDMQRYITKFMKSGF